MDQAELYISSGRRVLDWLDGLTIRSPGRIDWPDVQGSDDRLGLAVSELPALKGCPDVDLLMCAALDERALVTENVKDFIPLHARLIDANEPHGGLILAPSRRFPRSRRTVMSHVASALDRFLAEVAEDVQGTPFLWWLERADA